jgi:hypothetical protein
MACPIRREEMSDRHFTVTWQAEDGYAGGARPHGFNIDKDEVDGMDEKELRKYFRDEIQNAFNETVSPSCDQEDEFVTWAKGVQEKEQSGEGE